MTNVRFSVLALVRDSTMAIVCFVGGTGWLGLSLPAFFHFSSLHRREDSSPNLKQTVVKLAFRLEQKGGTLWQRARHTERDVVPCPGSLETLGNPSPEGGPEPTSHS